MLEPLQQKRGQLIINDDQPTKLLKSTLIKNNTYRDARYIARLILIVYCLASKFKTIIDTIFIYSFDTISRLWCQE